MEIINQDSLVAPGDLSEAPISMTTTEANLTGSWKFFSPQLQEKLSPCLMACPIQNNIADSMHLLNQGEKGRALELLRETNPLPAITGRVCPRFCQEQCNRLQLDQEVLIGSIERHLGDFGLQIPYPPPEQKRSEQVAVVGSGPAGLAAAYFLARAGVQVTIYEKEAEPGGLLRWGIPEYRLPKTILSREIDNLLKSLDIQLECNRNLSVEEIEKLQADYQAVFCAPGLGASVLPPEFAGYDRVLQGLDLLHDLQLGLVPEGEKAAVIGGGNVAVDVARSLWRHGKQVEIIYRRSYEEMPAYTEEKRFLSLEGIPLHEQSLVTKLTLQDERLSLSLSQAERVEGRIKPGLFKSERLVDLLILAVGQQEHLQIEPINRLFVGGDLQLGASTVVEAMASGRQGAWAILHQLDPDLAVASETEEELLVAGPESVNLTYVPWEEPIQPGESRPEQPLSGFAEIDPGLSEKEAARAAARCLSCGKCTACGLCWFFCPDVSIGLEEEANTAAVAIDPEHCKGCGLCASVCPRGVIRMEEG